MGRLAKRVAAAVGSDGTKRLRTFALVGHRSAGKTSVAELLLTTARVTREPGEVDEGTALLDWTATEKRRRQSLDVGTAWFEWGDALLQLLDTPGADCLECLRDAALAACDAAVVVVDETAGIEHGTRAALAAAERFSLPVLAVLTKTDLAARDRDEPVVEALTEAAGFRAALLDERHNETLAEVAALGDDELLERYLEYLELPDEVVAAALPSAVAERRLLPVVLVCPPERTGAAALLDAIARLVPSPFDRPLRGRDASGHPVELDRTGPFLARVVSAHRDEGGSPFHVLRVEAGEGPAGDVTVGSAGSTTRLRKLYRIRGPRRAAADPVVPGMLVATWDALEGRPGDTLTSDPARTLEPLFVAPPMMTWALRNARRRGAERLVAALEAVTSADPGLSFAFDRTGAPLLSGADDEHLRLAVERMEEWEGVKVTGELPPVGYQEHPLRSVAEAEGTHRVNGGDGLPEAFARCRVSLDPIPVAEGIRFVDTLGDDDDDVPRAFRPAVEEGVRSALAHGPTAGFPVTGVLVRLVGGAYDMLQSTGEHFRLAGGLAVRAALERAKTRLLEPWSEVDVTVPSDTLGALLSDVGAHRGRVLGVDVAGTAARLRTAMPDDELRTFSRRMKRLTAGRGRFRSWGIGLEVLPAHRTEDAMGTSPHPGRVTLTSRRPRGAVSSPPSTKSGRRPAH